MSSNINDKEVCECLKENKDQTCCRYYVDYEKDCNCVLVTVANSGSLTLRETAKRLDISYVRVKQIQDSVLGKLRNIMLSKDFC